MTQRKNRNLLCLALAALLLLCACTAGKPETPEEFTQSTLRAMGAKDAVYVGEEMPFADDTPYDVYTSEATGFSYYFDTETGLLKRAEDLGAPEQEPGKLAELSYEEHKAYALKLAKSAVQNVLFGELQVESETPDNTTRSYVFAETYEGIPTGTKVRVGCLENHEIFGISLIYGSVFQKNEDGSYTLAQGDELISEETACDAARKAAVTSQGYSGFTLLDQAPEITLTGHKDSLYYEVKLDAEDDNDRHRCFTVRVDAFDAEILSVAHCK